MLPYARMQPGPGFRLGPASLYYAQRLVTRPGLRRSISRAIAAAIRARHGTGFWAPVDTHYAHVAPMLRQQGIATLPKLVSEAAATAILNYFLGKEVVGKDGRPTSLDRLAPGTGVAAYPLSTVLENADVLNLINAAPVLRIAADYLGCKPTLSSLGVRWSFPASKPLVSTQHFHRDPDDWQFLKLFVYLTDVDAGSGPHAYVMHTSRTGGAIRARPYASPIADGRYTSDQVCTMLGPRGTAFMADTYGIHAGLVPTHTPRLMLQAQYSLLPVFAFRYEPLVLAGADGLDPYVNRLLFRAGVSPP